MQRARLEELYLTNIRPELKKSLALDNIMETPKISKIVLNVGLNGDDKAFKTVIDILGRISGQAPVKTLAKKSIAAFKIREGMPLGVMVTLRKKSMYDFLDKLINLALPKTRDFQGTSLKFDGRGNYNLGLKEWNIFPEADFGMGDNVYGLNISIHTTAHKDEHALELLKSFGMPFRKNKNA